MANGYKQIDGKIIQLTDEEQKEFESRDFSDAKKSPSDIEATCDLESADQAPIECGFCWANCFTEPGARRSESPSRKTGLTAEPLTLS